MIMHIDWALPSWLYSKHFWNPQYAHRIPSPKSGVYSYYKISSRETTRSTTIIRKLAMWWTWCLDSQRALNSKSPVVYPCLSGRILADWLLLRCDQSDTQECEVLHSVTPSITHSQTHRTYPIAIYTVRYTAPLSPDQSLTNYTQ